MAYAKNKPKRKNLNKGIFCTNCGKTGHEWRDCSIPTTSWGIILVNVSSRIPIVHDDSDGRIKIYSTVGIVVNYWYPRTHIDENDSPT